MNESSCPRPAPYHSAHAIWNRRGNAIPLSSWDDTPHVVHERGALVLSGPVTRHRGGLTLVADARIDNRVELRQACSPTGEDGDEALIAAAYRRWGVDCAERLIGDFAFVLWDESAGLLLAARDVMGARPLFVRQEGSLLGLAVVSRDLSRFGFSGGVEEEALLAWVHQCFDDHYSMFKGVTALPPGHRLVADRHKLSSEPYWDFGRVQPLSYKDPRDYFAHFREVFDRCVADRCQSDGAVVGTTLSGGMDSTSVTSSAAAFAKVQPFSFMFRTLADCDETGGSRAVTRHLGLDEPIWMDCESDWLLKGAFQDNTRRDNPFQCWDGLDRMMLAQLADMGGKVLLTGHGGDSLMTGIGAGYVLGADIWRGRLSAVSGLIRFLRQNRVPLSRGLYAYLLSPKMSPGLRNKIRRLLAREQAFHPWLLPNDKPRYKALIERLEHCDRIFSDTDRQMVYRMLGPLSCSIRRIIHWYNDMARPYGIEVRHPFFDRRLAELVLALPGELHRYGDKPKGFLREAMRGRLPPEVLNWMEKPNLFAFYHFGIQKERDNIIELIQNSSLADRGIVDSEILSTALGTYLDGVPGTVSAKFLPVIFCDLWLRNELAV